MGIGTSGPLRGSHIVLPDGGTVHVGSRELMDELKALNGLSSTELGFLDGVTAGTVTASKALVVDANKAADELTLDNQYAGANTGTANTGVTAAEHGDGAVHRTVLTISQADAFTIADTAALADGYLLYTLPAGKVAIHSAVMSANITAASTEAQSDTPDVGLGTTEATGAVATLDGTAAFENILTGQTATDANGTDVNAAVNTPLFIAAADDHTVYLNIADTWANDTGGDLTADLAGTVVLEWSFLGA